MGFSRKQRVLIDGIIALAVLFAVITGAAVGLAVSSTKNIDIIREIGNYEPALPTQVLDKHGRVITEFFGDQKREIVSLNELPKHLIYALITREDRRFYSHRGFDPLRFSRAVFDWATGNFSGGASTITQQVAGWIFADRKEKSITRKLKELWYSFQVERVLSKDQILELYVNLMPLGHGTDGVEAASQFYFNHSARHMTVAESAILVPLLSAPDAFSPIKNPEVAKEKQQSVLREMVQLGYLSQEEADQSVQEFWDNWDYTRSNITGAYLDNESLAPYFTEYVRQTLEEILYGSANINRDGYTVYTTLDLDYQEIADREMSTGYTEINTAYRNTRSSRLDLADQAYIPIVDMISLAFDVNSMKVAGVQNKKEATQSYFNDINPALDLVSLMFGNRKVRQSADTVYTIRKKADERTIVEGALITIENGTGHILAMVGGRDFEITKLNRAVQAQVQPGSAFKPLYYSAAISSRKFTPATRLYDGPMMWTNPDGTVWDPTNYLGDWKGSVLLRFALATSMNIPSIQVLEGVGFEAAIERASLLLGKYEFRNDENNFPRKYPLALGIVKVAPIDMVRAYATFPGQGKRVEPIGIIYVEDREGNTILEYEKELLNERKNGNTQLIPPQDAYMMVNLLQSTVEYGTLANRRRQVGGFGEMAMAGKTGTTQNWGDAWTCGFSPYVTTAVWFGFDQPGNSLGRDLTGATAAGPVWARYMKQIHANLEPKDFKRPETGLVTAIICAKSGQLPTYACTDGTVEELFLAGTEPKTPCEYHEWQQERDDILLKRIQDSMMRIELPDLNIHDLQKDDRSSDASDRFLSNPISSDSENPLLD